ncbi:MAG TPA: DUF167 domain-containing protein [bacterium]|nr:DUF167 domain-containing protein [bacterium]
MPAPSAREKEDGVLIRVRAQPGASRNEIARGPDGILKVRVTAAAVEGAANKALIKLLSKSLGVPKSGIRIHSGETSRNKVIFVAGISAADVESRVRSQES